MLRHLRIEQFTLIESLAVEFDAGMTAITGESGAGKSVLFDSLGFLAGGRASAEQVRAGAPRAVVEAEFDIGNLPRVAAWLATAGLGDDDDPAALFLRREMTVGCRGRCLVNGRLATAAQLAEVGALLLDIHEQGAQGALSSPAAQRDLFDTWSGAAPLRESVASAHGDLSALLAERATLDAREREAEQRLDFLTFQIDELEGLALQPGEEESLRSERDRLAHVDELGRLGGGASAALTGDDAATDRLAAALRAVDAMARHDASLGAVAVQLRDACAIVEDAAATLDRYTAGLEADPSRLAEVDDRLAALRRALRKYGPREEDALARLESLCAERDELAHRERRRGELDGAIESRRRDLAAACAALAAHRLAARATFEERAADILRELALPKARLSLAIEALRDGIPAGDAHAGPAGSESVEILFASHSGEPLRPLRKVASGGELARVMLALQALAAADSGAPVMLFDEADAGLSGAAAASVGSLLADMARARQVLCVTHQPSVAARAAAHIAVTKAEHDGRPCISLRPLAQRERRRELARLLGGGEPSDTSIRLAGEMLARAAG